MCPCCLLNYFYPGNTRESEEKISSIEQRGDGCCIQPGRPGWLLKSWICKSIIQVPGPDFSMYTRGNPSSLSTPSTNENVLENWNATKNAPVVWFVSHCKDYNGRWEENLMSIQSLSGWSMCAGCKNILESISMETAATTNAARYSMCNSKSCFLVEQPL